MYTSPDDARSDLFLSVAVYLFGPLVFGILFRYLPVLDVPVLGQALRLAVAFATTALVPLLLLRYRREPLSWYGLSRHRGVLLGMGALAMLPLVVATILVSVLIGDAPLVQLPLFALPDAAFLLVLRLVRWGGTAFLAAYGAVKARDAFRSDPRSIRAGTLEIGRIIAIALAVAVVLLLLGGTLGIVPGLLLPLGALAGVAVALQMVRGPSAASRAVLLTPTVIVALQAFDLTLDGRRFFLTLWLTGITACIGLVIGVFQESRNSAWAALGAAVVIALLTSL